jgi:hypothetical protein
MAVLPWFFNGFYTKKAPGHTKNTEKDVTLTGKLVM